MALTATRPIVKMTEDVLHFVARLLGGSVQSWWLSLLVIGTLLGSFITEAGAMTITATLLARQFYENKPTPKLAYATLGLLFTNISIGGLLTTFAAPPVLLVARCWEWSSSFMFTHFGLRTLIAICLATLAYLFFFRKEFKEMQKKKIHHPKEDGKSVPFWIILVHAFFIVWTVVNSHYPVLFLGGFLLFLGFSAITKQHQSEKGIKKPLLVGLFLAGLIIHGGLQGWWINPLLSGLTPVMLMTVATVLTSFNDNAAVVYLASLINHLNESAKIALVSGAMTGGGLTVIANVPNPAGYVILRDYFQKGISPLYLFLGALFPTLLFYVIFSLPFWH